MSENQPRDNEEIFTLVDEKGNEELYKEAMRFKSDQNGNGISVFTHWMKKMPMKLILKPFHLNQPATWMALTVATFS